MHFKVLTVIMMSYSLSLSSGCTFHKRISQEQQEILQERQKVLQERQRILQEKIAICERYKSSTADCQSNNRMHRDALRRLNGEATCLRNKGYRTDVNYCSF